MPTVSELKHLRETVRLRLGDFRFAHTLAVEEEIAALGKYYLPQDISRLRTAALLHDITKEFSCQEQIALCRENNLSLDEAELAAPKILHAKTGALVAAREFSSLVDTEILDAIAKHTTGAENMSLFAKLLYLADYIEGTRTFPDCIHLRQMFWDGFEDLPQNKRQERLDRVLLESFRMTVSSLARDGLPIAPATLAAQRFLVQDINKYN